MQAQWAKETYFQNILTLKLIYIICAKTERKRFRMHRYFRMAVKWEKQLLWKPKAVKRCQSERPFRDCTMASRSLASRWNINMYQSHRRNTYISERHKLNDFNLERSLSHDLSAAGSEALCHQTWGLCSEHTAVSTSSSKLTCQFSVHDPMHLTECATGAHCMKYCKCTMPVFLNLQGPHCPQPYLKTIKP